MQNGVFLHTKEDVNTGCLETLFLITLFKFNTDVIDDFKGRHYWSTSQTSPIDCKSRMNKSFFLSLPRLSLPLRKRLYNQSISVTYMGSSGAKSPPFRKKAWARTYGTMIAEPRGTFEASHIVSPIALSFFTCENSSIYSLISGILLQIACLCWSPQRDKVQEWLFYGKSASCAASCLSLQSAMEWWMLWQIVVFFSLHLHSPLTCPHGSCLYFVIPPAGRGLLISEGADSHCMSNPCKSTRGGSRTRESDSTCFCCRKILHIQGGLTRLMQWVCRFNYRKPDWLRINGMFSITTCWNSLARHFKEQSALD